MYCCYAYVEAVAERCASYEVRVSRNHVYGYVEVRRLTHSDGVEFDVACQAELDVAGHVDIAGGEGYVDGHVARVGY